MTSESNRWRSRPLLAAALRLAIVAVPLLIGYGASVLAVRLLTLNRPAKLNAINADLVHALSDALHAVQAEHRQAVLNVACAD